MNQFIGDFFKPILLQFTEKKIEIYVRELTEIPHNICLDIRLYQLILY